jgi:L-lactate dehydrogenase
MTNVAGISIDDYCPFCKRCSGWKEERQKIEKQVRESAYHIINAKGSTCFAVGLALVKITATILRKQNSVLSVSVVLDGEFGLKGLALSVPCIISDIGVEKIISSPLSDEEMELLNKSASVIKEAISQLKN